MLGLFSGMFLKLVLERDVKELVLLLLVLILRREVLVEEWGVELVLRLLKRVGLWGGVMVFFFEVVEDCCFLGGGLGEGEWSCLRGMCGGIFCG